MPKFSRLRPASPISKFAAAEQIDWLSLEALCLYSKSYLPAEGAGAIYLEAAVGAVMGA